MKRDYTNLKWDRWYEEILIDQSKLPFSFTYNGKIYKGFDKEHFTRLHKSVCTK